MGWLVKGIVSDNVMKFNAVRAVSLFSEFNNVRSCFAFFMHYTITFIANYEWMSCTNGSTAANTCFMMLDSIHDEHEVLLAGYWALSLLQHG